MRQAERDEPPTPILSNRQAVVSTVRRRSQSFGGLICVIKVVAWTLTKNEKFPG